jgi:hypothetical protein
MSDIRQQDKAEYRRLLDEIGEDYCPSGRYCIFKEFLLASHPSRRLLVQLKSCDKAKFLWSKEEDKDIGWDKTLEKWVKEGYAEFFGDVYSDDLSPKEVFKLLMERAEAQNAKGRNGKS